MSSIIGNRLHIGGFDFDNNTTAGQESGIKIETGSGARLKKAFGLAQDIKVNIDNEETVVTVNKASARKWIARTTNTSQPFAPNRSMHQTIKKAIEATQRPLEQILTTHANAQSLNSKPQCNFSSALDAQQLFIDESTAVEQFLHKQENDLREAQSRQLAQEDVQEMTKNRNAAIKIQRFFRAYRAKRTQLVPFSEKNATLSLIEYATRQIAVLQEVPNSEVESYIDRIKNYDLESLKHIQSVQEEVLESLVAQRIGQASFLTRKGLENTQVSSLLAINSHFQTSHQASLGMNDSLKSLEVNKSFSKEGALKAQIYEIVFKQFKELGFNDGQSQIHTEEYLAGLKDLPIEELQKSIQGLREEELIKSTLAEIKKILDKDLDLNDNAKATLNDRHVREIYESEEMRSPEALAKRIKQVEENYLHKRRSTMLRNIHNARSQARSERVEATLNRIEQLLRKVPGSNDEDTAQLIHIYRDKINEFGYSSQASLDRLVFTLANKIGDQYAPVIQRAFRRMRARRAAQTTLKNIRVTQAEANAQATYKEFVDKAKAKKAEEQRVYERNINDRRVNLELERSADWAHSFTPYGLLSALFSSDSDDES